MMSFLILLCIIASGVCFFASLFTQHLALVLGGSVFLLYALAVLHELGHVIGCKIRKNRIVSVTLFPLAFEQKRLRFSGKFKYSVLFETGTNDKLIYLLGPLFSVISVLFFLLFLLIEVNACTIVFFIVSLLPLIGCERDLYKAFNKI